MRGPSTDTDQWHFDPPEEILQSRIFAEGGYLVVSGLFGEDMLQALRAEADAVRGQGQRGHVSDLDRTEGRGGTPARAYRMAGGGDLHWGLHGCDQMAEALAQLCGAPVTSTGGGSYSYYEQEGDFLALHRDVLQCDVALITSLSNSIVDGSTGELAVYPEFVREPLSKARRAVRSGSISVPLARGQTAILLGGLVPHEVVPTCVGQDRIVAINCYRIQVRDLGD